MQVLVEVAHPRRQGKRLNARSFGAFDQCRERRVTRGIGVAGDVEPTQRRREQKGGKTRQCPLWPETERVLVDEILGRSIDDAVFVSRLGTPFTRFGVYRLIERCAARAPKLADRTITPHVIRHTTACHLVLAGVDINTIRAWLGHVSISTTNIYAEIDLTLKANAVALCEVGQPRPARSWKEDKDLMAFLKSL